MSDLGPIQDPDLASVFNQRLQDLMSRFYCHLIGSILSFNATNQTASVQIKSTRLVGDNVMEYPILVDCPVIWLFGGTGFLTFPIAVGDNCLVLFNDRNIDTWFTYGTMDVPNTGRTHSLSDGLILVGLNPVPSARSGYSTTDVQLGKDDAVLSIGGSKFGIRNAGQTLQEACSSLITHLTVFKDTNGDGPDATTIANLTADLAKFNALLK
jgi:hypothetical protein